MEICPNGSCDDGTVNFEHPANRWILASKDVESYECFQGSEQALESQERMENGNKLILYVDQSDSVYDRQYCTSTILT